MNKQKLMGAISLLCNFFIFSATFLSIISYFVSPKYSHTGAYGAECFKYFTVDSNVLCAIASLCLIPYNIITIKKGKKSIPFWAILLKFVGTVAVTLTFMTVLFFLGPVSNSSYTELFQSHNLYMHLLTPLFAIFSFFVVEIDYNVNFKWALTGLLPIIIYGMLYLTMVILIGSNNGGWIDFYGFNIGGMWWFSLPVMLLVGLVISFAIASWHNLFKKVISGEENK